MRVVKTDMERNGLMRIAAVAEDISSYNFDLSINKHRNKNQIPELIPETLVEILDIPPLPTDTATQISIKIAACGNGDNWAGSVIYIANDNDKNFVPLTGISDSATMGIIITDLKHGTSVTFDQSNSVNVILFSGQLYSVTELSLLNGSNLALIGDELFQFQNAELIGDSRYRLSRLLRGRHGTERSIQLHESGTRFILITPALFAYNITSNMIGRKFYYKAVTSGQHLEEVAEREFVIQANFLKPLAPVHVNGKRDKQNNLTITWIRRARFDNDWLGFIDVPLDEKEEKYAVEIINKEEVVRIIETSSPSATYSEQQQILDFKEIPKQITIRVY